MNDDTQPQPPQTDDSKRVNEYGRIRAIFTRGKWRVQDDKPITLPFANDVVTPEWIMGTHKPCPDCEQITKRK